MRIVLNMGTGYIDQALLELVAEFNGGRMYEWGNGSFKTAYLSDSGVVFKVTWQDHEHVAEMEAYDTLCQLEPDAVLPVLAHAEATAYTPEGEQFQVGVMVQPLAECGEDLYRDSRGWEAVAMFSDDMRERGWVDMCLNNCGLYNGQPVVLDYGGHCVGLLKDQAA